MCLAPSPIDGIQLASVPGMDTCSSFFRQTTGGMVQAASLLAGICSLAACAPDEAPDATADGERPAPYRFAEADMGPVSGSDVGGAVRFDPNDEFLQVQGRITGLTAGAYGLRVHQARDCAVVDSHSAGPLFSTDPMSPELALDPDLPNEAGNLGDIVVGEGGTASFDFVVTGLGLGPDERSVLGHTLVIHASAEGVGPQGLPVLAGKPVGCGEIELIPAPKYVR